jgi:DNA-binding transcriptional LysR family regulator
MTPLAHEQLRLVCRTDHRLADQTEITVERLADERSVDVPPGWTARLLSDAAFASAGVPRRIVCEVGDWELFVELVSAGIGIGFPPEGLLYPVLTAPHSVQRLVAVAGIHLEHISSSSPRRRARSARQYDGSPINFCASTRPTVTTRHRDPTTQTTGTDPVSLTGATRPTRARL